MMRYTDAANMRKEASYYVPRKPLSPERLRQLYQKFRYRVLNKVTGKPQSNTNCDTFDKYKSLSDEEMLRHRIGICYDTAKLSDSMLTRQGIEHKNIFARADRADAGDYPTHTFTVYKNKEGKWKWLEGSWEPFKDNDWQYDDPDALIRQVLTVLSLDSGNRMIGGEFVKFPLTNSTLQQSYDVFQKQTRKPQWTSD